MARFVVLIPLLLLGACNIVGPVAYLVHGPEKIEKAHALDPERRTVIFVDDPANLIPRRAVRTAVAVAAQDSLLQQGVLENVIDARSAMLVASKDDPLTPMPIEELGRAVEADVVIYAVIDEFVLTTDGQSLTPSAKARVKVIDAVSGKRVFPAPEEPGWVEGHPLALNSEAKPGYFQTATLGQKSVEQTKLAERLGLGLAQLFYTHEKQTSARAGG